MKAKNFNKFLNIYKLAILSLTMQKTQIERNATMCYVNILYMYILQSD